MAWPRTGLVILNNTAALSASACLTPAPTASCGGGPGGGGSGGGGGIGPTLVGQILNTNMNVIYYKINLGSTVTNMYGESLEKWYYNGVNVRCNIERGEITNGDDDFGVTINNTVKVIIPRDLLQSYNFLPEVGDIFMDRERYYEVNSIDQTFVVVPGVGSSNGSQGTTGQTVMYALTGYLTRVTKLNIIEYYQ